MGYAGPECFLNGVKNHIMIVNKDGKDYRHLIFVNPESSAYSFNITTFPLYLVVTGDMGSIVFSKSLDMFRFFRDEGKILKIEPDYWAEKIHTIDDVARDHIFKDFDIAKELELVADFVKKYIEKQKKDNPDKQIDDLVLRNEICSELVTVNNENEFAQMLLDFQYGDFNFDDYDYQLKFKSKYIWLCYAIVWGIRQYDAYKSRTWWQKLKDKLFNKGRKYECR